MSNCGGFPGRAVVLALCALSVGWLPARAADLEPGGTHERHADALLRATAAGCKVVDVPEQRTFFVYWLPDGFERFEHRRVWVMLHGEGGNACDEVLRLRRTASAEGFGLVAVQWAREADDYMKPDAVYDAIRQALRFLERNHGVDAHRCAWLGFGRAATDCLGYVVGDRIGGERFFSMFVAVSGPIDVGRRVTRDMLAGRYGVRPLEGVRFYLWSGGADRGGATAIRSRRSARQIGKLGGDVTLRTASHAGLDGFYYGLEFQRHAARLWRRTEPVADCRDLLATRSLSRTAAGPRLVLPVDVAGKVKSCVRPGDVALAICTRRAGRNEQGPQWQELRAGRRLALLQDLHSEGLVKAVAVSSVDDLWGHLDRVPKDAEWLVYVMQEGVTPRAELRRAAEAVPRFVELARASGRKVAWAPGPYVLRREGDKAFALAAHVDRCDLLHTRLLAKRGLAAFVTETQRRAILIWQASPECEVGVQVVVAEVGRKKAAAALTAVGGVADVVWPHVICDAANLTAVASAIRPLPASADRKPKERKRDSLDFLSF